MMHIFGTKSPRNELHIHPDCLFLVMEDVRGVSPEVKCRLVLSIGQQEVLFYWLAHARISSRAIGRTPVSSLLEPTSINFSPLATDIGESVLVRAKADSEHGVSFWVYIDDEYGGEDRRESFFPIINRNTSPDKLLMVDLYKGLCKRGRRKGFESCVIGVGQNQCQHLTSYGMGKRTD